MAECCGFGGTFSVRRPAISGAMVPNKPNGIRDCGVDVLSSTDFGYLLNLHHADEKRSTAGEQLPRCMYLATFVRERLGADAAQQVKD